MKLIATLLFLILILSACSPAVSSAEAPPLPAATDTQAAVFTTDSSPVEVIPFSTREVLPRPKLIATLSTPHIDPGPDGAVPFPSPSSTGCTYQWAQQPLPELSDQFLRSVQEIQPAAQANAFAFGENCIHSDGTADFLPIETDFNISLPVGDATDAAELGGWVVEIMQAVDYLPPDQIAGPRPGRVSITFANGQQEELSFYIDQYRALPGGLSPAEIYRTLKSQQ